jgi:hypothetical protein
MRHPRVPLVSAGRHVAKVFGDVPYRILGDRRPPHRQLPLTWRAAEPKIRAGARFPHQGIAMTRNRSEVCGWSAALLAWGVILVMAAVAPTRSAAQQVGAEVPPDATPEVTAVRPNQGAPGQEVLVVIEGKSFSPGVYVSFSNPSLHAVSTRRVSPTELEARVAIGAKAQPGTVSLFVSNPGSTVAETPFSVTSVGPSAVPAEPAAPAAPTPVISAPAQAEASAEAMAPEVTRIEPPRAAPGSQTTLKISGKNFAKGVKVVFSNPGIRVLGVQSSKDSEIEAQIQVAADAATGTTGMFVVNPDDNETEVTFEISSEGSSATSTAPAASSPTSSAQTPSTTPAPQPATKPAAAAKGAGEAQQFDVISLSDVASILQSRNKPKGTLSLAGGKLSFEEAGKTVFAVPTSEIKEVGENVILGVNTGTFHIILTSGQTYNFIAASFRPADSQSIIDTLHKALK